MNAVFSLLTFQCLVGAFDNLWHHELEAELPYEPSARTELALHTARELLYALIFGGVAWLKWQGVWAGILIAILAAEIVVTLADFVVEDRTRRLPPLERMLHAILALSYGATLALWTPELYRWLRAPTAMTSVAYGPWSWLMTLFALGVFIWGLRDLFAVSRLGVPQWQRRPLLGGRTIKPRVVVVTGATGFIGRALTRRFVARGDHVIALSRRVERARYQFGPWVEVCGHLSEIGPYRRIDAIVNLAGAPVVGPWWTAARRRHLISSRLGVTAQVLDLVKRLQRKPDVLVNASAIGYYGERGAEPLHEDSGDRGGFLSELCRRWEAAAVEAERFGVRVCRIRIGLVLGDGGGVLRPLALSTRFGLGAVFGNGRQWVSWIHRQDLVRLIDEAIDHPEYSGAYNAVAPGAVKQRELANTLAATLHRPRFMRVPAVALRLLAGEMADLFLVSQRVIPQRLSQSGFEFAYPDLPGALKNLLVETKRARARAKAATVFVNQACTVCRTEMGHYRCAAERAHRNITFDAIKDEANPLASFGLVPADLRHRLFVLKTDGELCSGIDALIVIWQSLRGYRWLAAIVSVPGFYQISAMVYDLVCAPLLTWWNERRHNEQTATAKPDCTVS
jgi:uncharacterized protein (TIGR01777 family)